LRTVAGDVVSLAMRGACLTAASVVVLAAAPATASACASLGRVTGFTGAATTAFLAETTGPDEPGQAQYGTRTITLDRTAHADIALGHKKVTRSGVVTFIGKAKGGDVHVNDTLDDSGDESAYTKDGSLGGSLPDFASAQLFVDPKTCKYQLSFVFFTKAEHSGGATGSDRVEGTVYGHREHVPRSLKLTSGQAPEHPDAYYGCPGDPLLSGTSCYDFSGGFATDFMTLFQCHSAQAVNCKSDEGPLGDATFAWHLTPHFKK